MLPGLSSCTEVHATDRPTALVSKSTRIILFEQTEGRISSVHHRVTQSLTEFNRFEIKRIELRETLCYSVVRTYYYTVTRKHPFHFIGTFVSLLWDIYFLGKTLLFLT